MADTVGETIYSALTAVSAECEFPFAVYVAGDAPAEAPLPFVEYQRASARAENLRVNAMSGARRFIFDVYASLPSQAETIADAIEEGLKRLTVAGGAGATPLVGGLTRAEGTYRVTDYPEAVSYTHLTLPTNREV